MINCVVNTDEISLTVAVSFQLDVLLNGVPIPASCRMHVPRSNRVRYSWYALPHRRGERRFPHLRSVCRFRATRKILALSKRAKTNALRILSGCTTGGKKCTQLVDRNVYTVCSSKMSKR
jgi:hypothetical protein